MFARCATLIQNPRNNLLYLARYIDDIIGVWDGDKKDIIPTLKPVTSDKIKLTFVIAEDGGLEALDLLLRIEGGTITTKINRKKTDGHQFLHWNSAHPTHLKSSIPYSQLLRYRRNCIKDEDFLTTATELLQRFAARGYPAKLLNEALEKTQLQWAGRSTEQQSQTDWRGEVNSGLPLA